MVTKQQKQETVAELVELLKDAQGIYLLNFNRVSVKEERELRAEFRKGQVKYRVAKNTLIKRAFEIVGGYDIPESYLKGQTGIALGYEDPIAPAKILKDYTKKNDKLQVKAAVIEKQLYDGSKLALVASLPTRPELIAGILGSLEAPISGIVGSINAVMRDLASVIEEAAKKRAA